MSRSLALRFAIAGTAIATLGALAAAVVFGQPNANASPVDPTTASLMSLSPRMDGSTKAPEFSLTDQSGRRFSLASLRGRPVVITFLDPHCTDICPIISAEFAQADRLLGADARNVSIVAINVNPYSTSTPDVEMYVREHNLSGLRNFSFLTGSPSQLQEVWKHYGIFVQAPSPTADVVHTSVTYFLDSGWVVRYEANPEVDHRSDGTSFLPPSSITSWANGIAEISRSLTP